MKTRHRYVSSAGTISRAISLAAWLVTMIAALPAQAQQLPPHDRQRLAERPYSTTDNLAVPENPSPTARATTEPVEVLPIDLPSALRLAGVQNPMIAIAYQRTLETTAIQQYAAAQLLPNLNLGSNYDAHSGALMQASGNVLDVSREALYVGAGANAVAAGSVNIPGVQFNQNASDLIFRMVAARPLVQSSRFANRATGNNLQLAVVNAYGELLRAEGQRAISLQVRDEAAEIARVTTAFARTGQGRASEAERAANELSLRESDIVRTEAAVKIASARLIALLNMRPSVRFHAAEPWVVPRPIVPDTIQLTELLAMALYQRPELGQFRAAVDVAMANLQGAQALPFSPQIMAGFSSGYFGGGSGLVASANQPRFGAPVDGPRFGNFFGRDDFDIIMYWSLRNLGVGNRAMIEGARARLGAAQMERLIVLNQVQAEIVAAYARKHTVLAQLVLRQQAVEMSGEALKEDLLRTRNNEGRPIEVLDSLRLLSDARIAYLGTIVDYNEAHFALYTAVGQPPADLLVRPAAQQAVPRPDSNQ